MHSIGERVISWYKKESEGWDWPKVTTTVLIVFSFLLPITWFQPGKILWHGDPIFPLDPLHFATQQWSLWMANPNLGQPGDRVAGLLYDMLNALPIFFGASLRTAEMFHFMLWFALPGLTIALFVNLLTRRLKISGWAVPIATAFYLYNLYRLAIFGDNNQLVAYTIIPLALYQLTLAFEAGDNWWPPIAWLGLSTLIFAGAGGMNPPMYLMLIVPMALYGATLTLADLPHWRRSLKIWLALIITALLVNLYWILPFIQLNLGYTSFASAGQLNWLDDVSHSTSLPNVLRLIGAWDWFGGWQGEPYAPFAQPYITSRLWSFLALIPALLIPIGFFFKKQWNRYILPLVAIGLIGLGYSQGTHEPFAPIFRWSIKHIPFLWAYRSPWYKFTNLTALAYAVLIGIGLALLIDFLSRKKLANLGVVLALIATIFPLVLNYPFITGSRWLTDRDVSNLASDHVQMPDYIREAADWINAQPGDTAVALLPYQAGAMFNWGLQSALDPLFWMSRRPILYRGDQIGMAYGETPGASLAYRVFVDRVYVGEPQQASNVARLMGMEYVVVRNDINYTFYNDSDSPEFIKTKLAAIPDLHLVKTFGQWDIYQFENAHDNRVFATTWVSILDAHPIESLGDATMQPTAGNSLPAFFFTRPVKQPNPEAIIAATEAVEEGSTPPQLTVKHQANTYTVSGQSDKPFILVLNQSIDSHWLAASRDAKVGPLMVANGYAPSWLITPKGEFRVTITFGPQKSVVPAAIVSLLTIIGVGYSLYRRRRATV